MKLCHPMTDLIPISTFNSCRMNGTITPVQKYSNSLTYGWISQE